MKWFRVIGLLLGLAVYQRAQAQITTVTWGTTHQTMDGFGGADLNLSNSGCNTNTGNCFYNFTNDQINAFFSPTSGIGLQYVRTHNKGCPLTGSCAVSTSNVPDLANLQTEAAQGVKVFLSLQPPANLKYSGNYQFSTIGADGGCIDTSEMGPFATYIVQWIQMLQANSVPIAAFETFQESDQTSGQCYMTASLWDTWIKTYLGPALTTAGLSTPYVMTSDSSPIPHLFSTCLADSSTNSFGRTCGSYVSAVSYHGYNGNHPAPPGTGYCCAVPISPPANTSGKQLWVTEINGGYTYNSTASLWNWDASMHDALTWAQNIHGWLTIGNLSYYQYWELADCCNGGPLNDGLMQNDLTTASARMYVIGNWSKFIASGWVRIDTTINPQTGVYVTAFKNPVGTAFTIVVINTNSTNTSQAFSLSGFPDTTSVTPYVTNTSSSGLVQQSSVAVSSSAFTYTLAASSVTTFVGNTTTTPVPPPSGLAAAVH